ncbi:hypothetical protein QCA50_018146 [Cerrena zonata]|uniref:P-type ATPase A domain-containing protein n=1 Tax=Cerrena zonata TaxID=2478898 RepID=A0AAW0FIQ0_9APHY
MVIALAIKDWISGGVIAFVVFINIFVGFIQEFQAEKTMGSLRSLSSPTARVLRNGEEAVINAEDVIPGDIIHIKVGDTVPADIRIVDSMNLETDEALLTGESLPVAKNHKECYFDTSVPVPVGDRLNMAYSSSIVSKGRASGIVVRTGISTEVGSVDDICSDKTGTLTMGKMIAKKLWIPGLGTYAVSNSNEVFNPTVGDLSYNKNSPHYIKESDEEFDFTTKLPSPEPSRFKNWLTTATLANISTINQVTKEDSSERVWEAHGDATEIAINVFTTRLNYTRSNLIEDESLEHINEFPFDSSTKKMSAIYAKKNSSTATVYTKGAVERVLSICKYWYGVNGPSSQTELVPLTETDKELIEASMNALSIEGLRVLAFAQRECNMDKENTQSRDEIESNLIFIGLIGIYDPPRPETAHSVKLCHRAGINVHMLTGDMLGTARAIAQEVGILPRNLYHYGDDVIAAMCITANEFDSLTDEQIDALPILPLVVARCAPQTKVRVIEALHRRKRFVAMTGDGVNDSPSLKKADVGIAMGLNGSDVAKDASDIVLTDDNFASILNAIEEGRRMSANIQKEQAP